MRLLAQHLDIRDDELRPLAAGTAGFCAALAGYFLLLPLRDEAGISLGTDVLPRLFTASLFLTVLATPLATAFLNRAPARELGLQRLFRALALSILGFVALYTAAGSPAPQGAGAADPRAPPGAAQLTGAQAAVRVAFFLWVSLLNLIAVSTLWARSADVFSPEAAGRLFGLLGAGATLGQLLGSLAARQLVQARVLGGGRGSPSLLPLLASAAMLEAAGQAARRYRLAPPGTGDGLLSSVAVEPDGPKRQGSQPASPAADGKGLLPARSARRRSPGGSMRGGGGSSESAGLLGQLIGPALEGYRMIRASPYLTHICAYLALNYINSSLFYFSKNLVVARVPDAASRTRWFASINSISACAILALQVAATGRLLRALGLAAALAVLPAAAGALMAGVAAWPSPLAVGGAEVLRKLLAYALARPARESLFTVVSREEKYKAKIFMDTVVQRVGDTAAAAMFQTLVPALGFGPSGLALACVPVCAAWAAVAFRLGQRQLRLAARPLAP